MSRQRPGDTAVAAISYLLNRGISVQSIAINTHTGSSRSEVSMRFGNWENPKKPGQRRIYINGAAALTHGEKLWWQPDEAGRAQLHSPGLNASESAELDDQIKQALVRKGYVEPEHKDSFESLTALDESRARVFIPASNDDGQDKETRLAGPISGIEVHKIRAREPVSIVLSHNVSADFGALVSRVPNVVTAREQLPCDMVINDRVRIEYFRNGPEAGSTLADDIRGQGDLFNRIKRLRVEESARVALILEGDPYKTATFQVRRHLTASLSYLSAAQEVAVLPTLDPEHTVYALVKFALHEKAAHAVNTAAQDNGQKRGLLAQRLGVLQALPGVNRPIAEALLAAFGSIEAIALASRDDLIKVKGIGPNKADKIIGILTGAQ